MKITYSATHTETIQIDSYKKTFEDGWGHYAHVQLSHDDDEFEITEVEVLDYREEDCQSITPFQKVEFLSDRGFVLDTIVYSPEEGN